MLKSSISRFQRCLLSIFLTAVFLCTNSASAMSCNKQLNSSQGSGQIQTQTSDELLGLDDLPTEQRAQGREVLVKLSAIRNDHSSAQVELSHNLAKGDYNLAVYQTRVSRSQIEFESDFGISKNNVFRLKDISNQEIIGSLEYTISNAFFDGGVSVENGAIYIVDYKTLDQYAPLRPIADSLFKNLIARHVNIKQIRMDLLSADVAAVRQALKNGLSPEQALEATPIYMSLNKLGFSKIVKGFSSVAEWEQYLTLERP